MPAEGPSASSINCLLLPRARINTCSRTQAAPPGLGQAPPSLAPSAHRDTPQRCWHFLCTGVSGGAAPLALSEAGRAAPLPSDPYTSPSPCPARAHLPPCSDARALLSPGNSHSGFWTLLPLAGVLTCPQQGVHLSPEGSLVTPICPYS